jgi:hypothetical protein
MIPTMTTACEGDGGMIPMMMMMMCEASRTDELILTRSGANHDEDPIPMATSLEESHDVDMTRMMTYHHRSQPIARKCRQDTQQGLEGERLSCGGMENTAAPTGGSTRDGRSSRNG